MKKLFCNKRIIYGILTCIVINIIDIYSSYKNLYSMYVKGMISESKFNENIISGDYYGVLNYAIVQMVVYLFFINMCIGKIHIEQLIRCGKRYIYWIKKLTKAMACTIAFVSVNQGCIICFIIIKGNINILAKNHWYEGLIFQAIVLFIFYLFVYIIYEISNTITHYRLAIPCTVLFFCILYYGKKFLFYRIWLPVDELNIIQKICLENVSMISGLTRVGMLMGILVIVSILFFIFKEREDLIISEKR